MQIQAGATLIQKNCDIIEQGGIKIVHNHAGDKHTADSKPLTEEQLKEKIAFVRERIGKSHRLWFPVCKYMMWRRMVTDGDFDSAVSIIERIFPNEKGNLDANDLSRLNVLCFQKGIDAWNDNDAPVHGTTFNKYLVIAELLDAL